MLAGLPGDDALRLVMAASGIGMAITDIHGVWQEVNPALCAMLGYGASELVGHPAAEVTHPDDIELSRGFIQRMLDEPGLMLDDRKRYLHRDGRVVWTRVNLAALRDQNGNPVCLLVQIRDITREVEREAGLKEIVARSDAELEASNHQLQLFADAVAHDLRAPLRSIESFSERLQASLEGRLHAVERDHLDRIRGAAGRMSDLLAALGRLSQATRAELRPAPVDIGLLVDWVHAELVDLEPGRDVDFEVELGERQEVEGDERLLKMLFDEVVGNAWKFTRGCPAPSIRIGAGRTGRNLRVTVADNGRGFDMQYAHKLFEPFQRLHSSEEGAGHGLGLAIARRVATRHGGRVSGTSRDGHGTLFTIELPLANGNEASRA